MVEAASLECVLAVAPVDSFGQPGTAHTLRATATNTDPATILRSALDDASVGVSDTGRTTDATTTKRPFSARDAMSLLVAKKRFGPWAAPPTEAVSREFLEGEFHRVPRKAHRALRKEVWGSLIRKGPPSKSAK